MHLAVITGASSGIGAALVTVARDDGATVASTSRRTADGDVHLSLDMAQESSWPRFRSWLADLVTDEVDRVTVVHAAGTVTPVGFMGEVDPDDLATAAILNSVVPQVIGDAALAAVGPERTATIMMITSGAATSAYAGMAHYCAGKAAMDQWVRVAGAEQDHRGSDVLVWAVAPGVVESAMQEHLRAADPEDFPNTTRHRRLAQDDDLSTSDEVAEVLWRLASERTHPNGAVLDVRDL